MSALQGIRVLDCTHAIAGPYCSMVLSDMGADVIKVESGSGDMSRVQLGDYRGYDMVNRGKRTLKLDLRSDTGVAAFRRIAIGVDILVENYRPGLLEKLGLGYPALSELNPALIYCSISGFGATGSGGELAGLDLIAQAMSGVMSFTGEPGGKPVVAGVPFADIGAGVYGALGILAALHERGRSGKGQRVEATLFESALAFATFEIGPYLRGGPVAERQGSGRKYVVPYGAFPTADGHIVLAVNTPAAWTRFTEILGDADLAGDPRFVGMAGRVAHRDHLNERIGDILKTRPADDWLSLLQAASIPSGRINDVAGAVDSPIAAERGIFPEVDGQRFIGTPIGLSNSPVAITGGPRELGQDNTAILQEAGFSAEEIAALEAAGTLG